jgi:hypothetical protein
VIRPGAVMTKPTFEVGRYISLERILEQHKDRYYETLEQASTGWHEGRHDPWPYRGRGARWRRRW